MEPGLEIRIGIFLNFMGAGHIMKREDVKQGFTVSHFKFDIKGIHDICIDNATLDEALFAYISLEEITEKITDMVRVGKRVRPVYCLKVGNES